MLKWWKSAVIALAAAVAFAGCASGDGRQTGGTKAEQAADGTAGPQTGRYEGGGDGSRPAAPGLRAPFPPGSVTPLQTSSGGGFRMAQSGQQPAVIPFVNDNGRKYIQVDELARLLQFQNYTLDPKSGVQEIGDSDVLIRLEAGSVQAEKEGAPFTLSEAPVLIGGKMMLPAAAAADLFAEEMVFEVAPEGFVVYPSDASPVGSDTDGPEQEPVDESLDFEDDPNDPAAGEDAAGVPEGPEEEAAAAIAAALETLRAATDGPEAVPALKNININALLRTAKSYLGVKYRFGAAPYPRSKRFDCSSYTQFVYGKYGISLPRTTRAQVKRGNTVSRKSLRRGDLLFFYVPGRYKSNKIAGHVGIYIGNRQMIHSNPEPKNGVQLRSIDRAYWKKTFLRAKRLAY